MKWYIKFSAQFLGVGHISAVIAEVLELDPNQVFEIFSESAGNFTTYRQCDNREQAETLLAQEVAEEYPTVQIRLENRYIETIPGF